MTTILTPFKIGEQRVSSCGNVYRLERIDAVNRLRVRRIRVIADSFFARDMLARGESELWDRDVLYCWDYCSWDSLSLVNGGVS